MRRLLLVAVVLAGGYLAVNAPPETHAGTYDWVVDSSNPVCKSIEPDHRLFSIQAAVNAASPGDDIFVCAGTYYENAIGIELEGLRLVGRARHLRMMGKLSAGTIS